MKAIKFRAWTATEIVYSDDYGGGYKGLSSFFDDCRNCDIMQYTGLKDKNDVEIYEGDLVSDIDGFVTEVKYGWFESDAFDVLGYHNFGGFIHKYYNPYPKPNKLCECHQKNIKIVGNIFQNPELLKQP